MFFETFVCLFVRLFVDCIVFVCRLYCFCLSVCSEVSVLYL